MAAATDRASQEEREPRSDAAPASTAWSIPEIRVIKDDQGRLRIDQSVLATYGAHAARQFLATAETNPKFRDGMTKRPSTPSIKIAYVNGDGQRQEIGVREIFCRMDGDALVLTHFENADGEKVKDLPISAPLIGDLDSEEDDADLFHRLALAELDDAALPTEEIESEHVVDVPKPSRGLRLPSGPLRQYDEVPADPTPAASTIKPSPAPEPTPRGPSVTPPVPQPTKVAIGPPVGPTVRALNEGEATALRAVIEAKAGGARWPNGLLMQAAERHPSDRKLQNEHIANLLRVSLDPLRPESRTPLAAALLGVLEEVTAYKGGVLDRDPLKAEKITLQGFAKTALGPALTDNGQVKTVSGSAQRTPAQILSRLEDPKLARATRVKFLLEIVPELIETWRPDKESNRSEAGNDNSPAIVRRLFSVANEQRQQRRFIDDGPAFKKATARYADLQNKLPKASASEDF